MTAFIINPKPLRSNEEVVTEVRNWLQNRASQGRPSKQDIFDQKWRDLDADDKLILAALVDEGGHDVKEVSIRRRLIGQYGIGRNDASPLANKRRVALSESNLVRLQHNVNDGDEMSLHPTWEWYVRFAVRHRVTGSEPRA
jgi:hypothetical protein